MVLAGLAGLGLGELARSGTYTATTESVGSFEVVQLTEGVGAAVYRYEIKLDNETSERYEHYGQVGRGSGSAIGGTGKYDGITGSHEYRFEAIDPDATQFVSKAQRSGRYRLFRQGSR